MWTTAAPAHGGLDGGGGDLLGRHRDMRAAADRVAGSGQAQVMMTSWFTGMRKHLLRGVVGTFSSLWGSVGRALSGRRPHGRSARRAWPAHRCRDSVVPAVRFGGQDLGGQAVDQRGEGEAAPSRVDRAEHALLDTGAPDHVGDRSRHWRWYSMEPSDRGGGSPGGLGPPGRVQTHHLRRRRCSRSGASRSSISRRSSSPASRVPAVASARRRVSSSMHQRTAASSSSSLPGKW